MSARGRLVYEAVVYVMACELIGFDPGFWTAALVGVVVLLFTDTMWEIAWIASES